MPLPQRIPTDVFRRGPDVPRRIPPNGPTPPGVPSLPTVVVPPIVTGSRKFDHVFVFPPERISDPCKNVLLVANMWNFAIGKADLLPDHKAFLALEVATRLIADPAAGARLVGLASRSGSDWFNLQLGKKRAENAKAELSAHIRMFDILNPPGPPERITTGSQGERFAERRGVADGNEEARFRSVLVTVLRARRRPCTVQLLPG
jgi:hypothetical protein